MTLNAFERELRVTGMENAGMYDRNRPTKSSSQIRNDFAIFWNHWCDFMAVGESSTK